MDNMNYYWLNFHHSILNLPTDCMVFQTNALDSNVSISSLYYLIYIPLSLSWPGIRHHIACLVWLLSDRSQHSAFRHVPFGKSITSYVDECFGREYHGEVQESKTDVVWTLKETRPILRRKKDCGDGTTWEKKARKTEAEMDGLCQPRDESHRNDER